MKILLIGNFAPPYEEESLHNLTLLNRLREEGNDCTVINISENPSKEDEFINVKGFFNFVFKLICHSWKKDIVHYLTKSYTRPSLLKVMTSVLISNIFLARSIVTFHSEMFSVFGQSRSQISKAPIYVAYYLMHKVICGDKHIYEIALRYCRRTDKFTIIPSCIHIPEDIGENERLSFKKLQDKKKVIVFSNVRYPSLLFDVLNKMLTKYLTSDTGIAVSFSEKPHTKLEHVIGEAEGRLLDNIVFIEPDNARLLSMAYARADLILRTMTCDGKIFFEDFAMIIRKPSRDRNYLYFPTSLLLIKEGDVSDLCAYILNQLLSEKREIPTGSLTEDFYVKIKKIYNE